jgi:hypothetical protein
MTIYNLNAMITVSTYTEVEANSAEEAIEIAQNRYCEFSGSGYEASECWIIDDVDGVPINITVENETLGPE